MLPQPLATLLRIDEKMRALQEEKRKVLFEIPVGTKWKTEEGVYSIGQTRSTHYSAGLLKKFISENVLRMARSQGPIRKTLRKPRPKKL